MSLLKELDIKDSDASMGFNTGTLFDLATGRYAPGTDGNWYLNGGLAQHISAFVGPNGGFKSTFTCSMIMRAMSIYNDSEALIMDTENSLDRDKIRATNMAEDLYVPSLPERIKWISGIDYNLDSFYDVIKTICKAKEEQEKDYKFKSIFIDEKTHKALEMWKPTFIFCDSLTHLITSSEDNMLNGDKAKSISDANTAYMVDGNKKTLFIKAIRRLCQKYGLIFLATGHFDKVMQVDMYNPTPKDTTFSLNDWKTKGCGSELKFLASIYARTKVSLMLDNNKEPYYGCGNGPSKDVMALDLNLERCKTSNAGEVLPFVVTQSTGLLNTVTNYNYLKMHDNFGMTGNKQKQQAFLLPDVSISRNTIRELSMKSYELRRALEIAAQYCFIRNNWDVSKYPIDFSIDPLKLYERLTSDKNKNVINDILNSRGYWTYSKDERPYMDIFKIFELAGALK